MKNLLKHTLFTLAAAMPLAALAEVTAQGTIRDAHTQLPLAGAYVQAFNDEKISTLTDSAGNFTLSVPDHVTSLRVIRSGYNPMQIALNGRTENIDANLYPDAFSNRVGLERTSRQSLSADISGNTADVSVDGQISAALGGQIRSISRGGVPGMGAYMLLGGINSLNANAQPLIVLDGVILDMQYNRSTMHDGFYNNLLANISVEDIASVTVLRNGTAIYGSKGANGVILINTKRNTSYSTHIDVSIAGKMEQMPNLPEMMNASQYRGYVSELLGTTGTKLNEFKFLRNEPDYYYYRVYHNDTDWSKQVYDEAFSQTYSINVQGGDDIANYNISLGYSNAEATLKKNDFTRFNLRLNSDVKLSKSIKVRLDFSYSDVNRDLRDDGVAENVDDNTITAPGFLSLIKSPFLSPYAYDTQGRVSSFLAEADDYLDEVIGTDASLANPSAILKYGDAKNKNNFGNRMVTLGISPNFELGHGLNLTESFSFVMFNTDEDYFIPVEALPTYKVEGVGYVSNKRTSNSAHQYLTTSDLRLTWDWQKDGHQLHLMGGWRYNLSRYQMNAMRGYNSGSRKSPNMSSSLAYKGTSGANEKVTTLTYYLQNDYNWAGKYYVDLGVSMEANSRFGKDADAPIKLGGVIWGLFPSASASWVASNEEWFPSNRWINYLRLNLGWDMSGNDDLDLNASKTYFKAVNMLSTIDGTVVGNIGNTSLKWETTKRLTWGADLNLLDNRLALSTHFFKSQTEDLLSLQHLSYLTGIDNNWTNGGELENTGFDINAQVKLVNTRNWQWELGLSVGHYKNKVTKLASGTLETNLYGADVLTKVGESVGVFYGYKTDGVFATTAEADAAALYLSDKTGAHKYFAAGDMKFVDQDGNHEINKDDRVIIGNPNPDIYGNISTHLQYKRLALNMAFTYSLGNDVYNYQRSILESGSRFYNQTKALRGRWSTEGQVTDIPRISYEDAMDNNRFSDRWIEDGSYLRLKNVTLSYKWDFDYRFLQGITIWGSADNLFTLTKYLGSDPEFSASNNVLCQGIDRGLLTASRSFSVGLKINL
ncbi:MAG: SusC/RagA family TonB-linked outer membrane protein [Bacteroidales bacterium]|nr:SusC/RagA family TonB-linked outer membrane protein [Bacteroidales bacterium]